MFSPPYLLQFFIFSSYWTTQKFWSIVNVLVQNSLKISLQVLHSHVCSCLCYICVYTHILSTYSCMYIIYVYVCTYVYIYHVVKLFSISFGFFIIFFYYFIFLLHKRFATIWHLSKTLPWSHYWWLGVRIWQGFSLYAIVELWWSGGPELEDKFQPDPWTTFRNDLDWILRLWTNWWHHWCDWGLVWSKYV